MTTSDKKILLALLCTQGAWACGMGAGPEILYVAAAVLVVAGLPVMLAPLIGMALARKHAHRFVLSASWCVPAGWAVSLAATVFLGLPGYFVGLIASVCVAAHIASRCQVAKQPEPASPGLNPSV
jgi:hypothetical protein